MWRADHPIETELIALNTGAASQAVERHVKSCPTCRRRLAEWAAIRPAVLRAFPVQPAPLRLLTGALAQTSLPSEPGMLRRLGWTWQVLVSQPRLIRREIWAASALVMTLGVLIAVTRGRGPAYEVLALFVPVTAGVGVSWICGSEADPARELSAAIPVPSLMLLLCRLVLVTGFDLCLALAASLVATGGTFGEDLFAVIFGWLGPMLVLTAFSLVLTVLSQPVTGIVAALALWCVRVLADSPIGFVGPVPLLTPAQADMVRAIWSTNALTLTVAALLMVIAFSAAPRRLKPS